MFFKIYSLVLSSNAISIPPSYVSHIETLNYYLIFCFNCLSFCINWDNWKDQGLRKLRFVRLFIARSFQITDGFENALLSNAFLLPPYFLCPATNVFLKQNPLK